MKKSIVFSLVLLIFTLLSTTAYAKISIGNNEQLKTVAHLPKTEEYALDDGGYLNIGILYQTFEIAGLPLWVTKQPKIVGVSTFDREAYYDISDEELQSLIIEHNLPSTEELKTLSFSESYIGWLLILGVVILYFLYLKFFKKESKNIIEEENSKEEN